MFARRKSKQYTQFVTERNKHVYRFMGIPEIRRFLLDHFEVFAEGLIVVRFEKLFLQKCFLG